MKLTLLSSISLSIALLIGNTTIANGQETSKQEIEQLCQKFPQNSKCENFYINNDIEELCIRFPDNKRCANGKPLISLINRPEETFNCDFILNKESKSGKCRIQVEDEKIIVYPDLEILDYEKNTRKIVIDTQDIFSFNSQWWLADVGNELESVGMFADIQIGYLLKNSQGDNKSNFLTISASESKLPGSEHKFAIPGYSFSNKNIPKVLEKLEPWLYHKRDLTAITPQLKPELNTADNQTANNVRRLLETKECPRCNLSGADLAEADLTRANLEGANLTGANLEGAKLGRAYLLGANLDNTNLYQADLRYSIMFLSSLENSDLIEADLRAANLQYSNLKGADLTVAKLDDITLNVTQLQNANLAEANLTEANLKCANLDSANLKNANLTKAKLGDCKPRTNMVKGEISSFLLNNAKISTPLSDAGDLLQVAGAVASFFSGFSNPNQNFNENGFDNLGVRKVKFIGTTNLNNANLSGANLTEADLDGANLFNSNLSNAILDSTDLKETDLTNSNLINAQINDLKLEEAFLCNTIMPDVSIAEPGCSTTEFITEEEGEEDEAN